ncbi:uncharacterized protein (TIGR01777 family) [Catenuloplanes nepalensis]|uniref:Uncharacterized protein (TIGR01777 family) n=1 Tax=Catenuloplanes nepalensis TaxID=587533 RepID=A0ABT9MK88_9ACTN|nr:TIGR01777 family oxidoreductase [Catenuloplanes nepalensis]MDP9791820.1 uncharacterized protein (TIGR01777 family) [Catenuloplanes nepalensis]
MRILLAGASGFLGTALRERLKADGHDLRRLVRRTPENGDQIPWKPSSGHLDPAALRGVDAVINLAGASIGGQRWTASYKRKLRSSRVDTTGTLARAIAALPEDERPKVFLNGSAKGWYGDTGDTPVEEEAPAADDFLGDLCRVWEAAARPAEDAGVRVVYLRSGLPLDKRGGLLQPLVLLFRAGLGGRIGSGRQYIPWISLADWVGATVFVLERDDITGPVNMVGPAPATNAEFTKELAAAVHRPALIPVPAFAMRAVLGEFATEILSSTRAMPGVLNRTGFEFRHPTLKSALRAAL